MIWSWIEVDIYKLTIMKRLRGLFFALFLVTGSLLFPTETKGQVNNIPEGRFLVIGAFNFEKNAIGFSKYVKDKYPYEVSMAYYPVKKYYYVYIKSYPEGADGLDDVRRMRRETEFSDVWFMTVTPYGKDAVVSEVSKEDKRDKSTQETSSQWTKAGGTSTTIIIPSKEEVLVSTNSHRTVVDAEGKVFGVATEDGKIIGLSGDVVGDLGVGGRVLNSDGKVIGAIGTDGFVIGASGEVIGALQANGDVIGVNGNQGEVIGSMSESGVVRNSSGELIGTIGAFGKVRDLEGNVIGAVGKYNQVIGEEGEVIGTVDTKGEAVDQEGNVIGTLGLDGKVRNSAGEVIGAVGAFGQVIGLDGSIIGIVGVDGQAVDPKGKLIGDVGEDGMVRNGAGEVIGRVGTYGEIIDFDGKVIGKIGSGGKAVDNNGDIIGTINTNGVVIDFSGSPIGSVGVYGQVIGNDGAVIGNVTSYGQVTGKDGALVGLVGSGLTPDAVRIEISKAARLANLDIKTKTIPKGYIEKGKYKLFFNTYYVVNYKEIPGFVDIVNPRTLRLLRQTKSQQLVRIDDPNNGDHSVQLIANTFGYKKVQHDIKLDEPFNEINEEFFYFMGDTLVADFPLQRYDKGDIATMYNVFFFKDAVVMKPISKFELGSLVDMLKENDELRIKIHGHTNGNARGKIIMLEEGSEEFFTLDQELKERSGSAKELSLQRAEVIKDYLISYGIAEDRMEVIGWGGKKPIYDKYDKLAIKNVRVEIEILDN